MKMFAERASQPLCSSESYQCEANCLIQFIRNAATNVCQNLSKNSGTGIQFVQIPYLITRDKANPYSDSTSGCYVFQNSCACDQLIHKVMDRLIWPSRGLR